MDIISSSVVSAEEPEPVVSPGDTFPGDTLPAVTETPIVQFYKNRTIFITGATGFLGKVLVQKLLAHCPKLSQIYLLIRPKRDSSPEKRLAELLSGPIFAELSAESLEKVVAIPGDITLPNLGISPEDEGRLVKTVSVIFHSAATVKFDDELTRSVQMNIEGTQMMVNLARKMSQLKAFIHTSTAFSHCYNEHIEEKFYPSAAFSPDDLIELCKTSDDEAGYVVRNILNNPFSTKLIIGKHPNTYTFTKAIAEQLLKETASDLPLAIVRPSIVVAAWKDPLPGWVDNLNGPTGMITGAASGILRSIMVTPDNVADIVPVDVVINLMCVMATKLGSDNNNVEGATQIKKSIPIYNCTSGLINPITWKEIMDKIIPGIAKYPLEKMVWFPNLMYQTNPWVHGFCHLTMHRLPALVIDTLIRLSGRAPFMGKIITRLEKATEALEFFSTRQWKWDTDNMQELEKNLDPEDRDNFGMDIKDLNWDSFMVWYAFGARHYVMKCDPTTVEASFRKAKILYRAHQALVFSLFLMGFSFLSLFVPFEVPGKFYFTCFVSFVCTFCMLNFHFDY